MRKPPRSLLLLAVLLVAAPSSFATGAHKVHRAGLGAALRGLLASKDLEGAEHGVCIWSLTEDRLVFESGQDRSLIPASNQKVVTIAAALSRLGPDYEFATKLYREGGLTRDGALEGNLWLVGGGDPTLRPPFRGDDENGSLADLVQALGDISRIRGDLRVDSSIFDAEVIAPGWPEDQLDRHYCAPVCGLSLNGNCLSVLITGAPDGRSVRLQPRSPGYVADGSSLRPSEKSREVSVWLTRPDDEGRIFVRGQVGSHAGTARQQVAVRDPDRYFGRALLGALQDHKVPVDGTVRRDRIAAAEGEVTLLYALRSPILPALYYCGKESDNSIAEHLFKLIAVESGEVGSFAAGASTVAALLGELGVSLEGVEVVDGSGLSRENRTTARALVRLLQKMYESELRDEFVRSMPIAGVDGTLDSRMTEPSMRYRVRAKTGYLRQVSALSGYLFAGSREQPEVFAFSILFNGFKKSNLAMKQIQDDICRAIVNPSH